MVLLSSPKNIVFDPNANYRTVITNNIFFIDGIPFTDYNPKFCSMYAQCNLPLSRLLSSKQDIHDTIIDIVIKNYRNVVNHGVPVDEETNCDDSSSHGGGSSGGFHFGADSVDENQAQFDDDNYSFKASEVMSDSVEGNQAEPDNQNAINNGLQAHIDDSLRGNPQTPSDMFNTDIQDSSLGQGNHGIFHSHKADSSHHCYPQVPDAPLVSGNKQNELKQEELHNNNKETDLTSARPIITAEHPALSTPHLNQKVNINQVTMQKLPIMTHPTPHLPLSECGKALTVMLVSSPTKIGIPQKPVPVIIQANTVTPGYVNTRSTKGFQNSITSPSLQLRLFLSNDHDLSLNRYLPKIPSSYIPNWGLLYNETYARGKLEDYVVTEDTGTKIGCSKLLYKIKDIAYYSSLVNPKEILPGKVKREHGLLSLNHDDYTVDRLYFLFHCLGAEDRRIRFLNIVVLHKSEVHCLISFRRNVISKVLLINDAKLKNMQESLRGFLTHLELCPVYLLVQMYTFHFHHPILVLQGLENIGPQDRFSPKYLSLAESKNMVVKLCPYILLIHTRQVQGGDRVMQKADLFLPSPNLAVTKHQPLIDGMERCYPQDVSGNYMPYFEYKWSTEKKDAWLELLSYQRAAPFIQPRSFAKDEQTRLIPEGNLRISYSLERAILQALIPWDTGVHKETQNKDWILLSIQLLKQMYKAYHQVWSDWPGKKAFNFDDLADPECETEIAIKILCYARMCHRIIILTELLDDMTPATNILQEPAPCFNVQWSYLFIGRTKSLVGGKVLYTYHPGCIHRSAMPPTALKASSVLASPPFFNPQVTFKDLPDMKTDKSVQCNFDAVTLISCNIQSFGSTFADKSTRPGGVCIMAPFVSLRRNLTSQAFLPETRFKLNVYTKPQLNQGTQYSFFPDRRRGLIKLRKVHLTKFPTLPWGYVNIGSFRFNINVTILDYGKYQEGVFSDFKKLSMGRKGVRWTDQQILSFTTILQIADRLHNSKEENMHTSVNKEYQGDWSCDKNSSNVIAHNKMNGIGFSSFCNQIWQSCISIIHQQVKVDTPTFTLAHKLLKFTIFTAATPGSKVSNQLGNYTSTPRLGGEDHFLLSSYKLYKTLTSTVFSTLIPDPMAGCIIGLDLGYNTMEESKHHSLFVLNEDSAKLVKENLEHNRRIAMNKVWKLYTLTLHDLFQYYKGVTPQQQAQFLKGIVKLEVCVIPKGNIHGCLNHVHQETSEAEVQFYSSNSNITGSVHTFQFQEIRLAEIPVSAKQMACMCFDIKVGSVQQVLVTSDTANMIPTLTINFPGHNVGTIQEENHIICPVWMSDSSICDSNLPSNFPDKKGPSVNTKHHKKSLSIASAIANSKLPDPKNAPDNTLNPCAQQGPNILLENRSNDSYYLEENRSDFNLEDVFASKDIPSPPLNVPANQIDTISSPNRLAQDYNLADMFTNKNGTINLNQQESQISPPQPNWFEPTIIPTQEDHSKTDLLGTETNSHSGVAPSSTTRPKVVRAKGINNPHNLCYAIATTQMLLSCSSLCKAISSTDQELFQPLATKPCNHNAIQIFNRILSRMVATPQILSYSNVVDIESELKHPNFNAESDSIQQQDALMFYCNLLEKLNLYSPAVKMLSHQELIITKRCPGCHNNKDLRMEHNECLKIKVPPSGFSSTEAALNTYFRNAEDAYLCGQQDICSHCKPPSTMIGRHFKLAGSPPRFIGIHYDRIFAVSLQHPKKLQCSISVCPFTAIQVEGIPTPYHLNGFVCHIGNSNATGHYTAYANREEHAGEKKEWFHFDDQHVSKIGDWHDLSVKNWKHVAGKKVSDYRTEVVMVLYEIEGVLGLLGGGSSGHLSANRKVYPIPRDHSIFLGDNTVSDSINVNIPQSGRKPDNIGDSDTDSEKNCCPAFNDNATADSVDSDSTYIDSQASYSEEEDPHLPHPMPKRRLKVDEIHWIDEEDLIDISVPTEIAFPPQTVQTYGQFGNRRTCGIGASYYSYQVTVTSGEGHDDVVGASIGLTGPPNGVASMCVYNSLGKTAEMQLQQAKTQAHELPYILNQLFDTDNLNDRELLQYSHRCAEDVNKIEECLHHTAPCLQRYSSIRVEYNISINPVNAMPNSFIPLSSSSLCKALAGTEMQNLFLERLTLHAHPIQMAKAKIQGYLGGIRRIQMMKNSNPLTAQKYLSQLRDYLSSISPNVQATFVLYSGLLMAYIGGKFGCYKPDLLKDVLEDHPYEIKACQSSLCTKMSDEATNMGFTYEIKQSSLFPDYSNSSLLLSAASKYMQNRTVQHYKKDHPLNYQISKVYGKLFLDSSSSQDTSLPKLHNPKDYVQNKNRISNSWNLFLTAKEKDNILVPTKQRQPMEQRIATILNSSQNNHSLLQAFGHQLKTILVIIIEAYYIDLEFILCHKNGQGTEFAGLSHQYSFQQMQDLVNSAQLNVGTKDDFLNQSHFQKFVVVSAGNDHAQTERHVYHQEIGKASVYLNGKSTHELPFHMFQAGMDSLGPAYEWTMRFPSIRLFLEFTNLINKVQGILGPTISQLLEVKKIQAIFHKAFMETRYEYIWYRSRKLHLQIIIVIKVQASIFQEFETTSEIDILMGPQNLVVRNDPGLRSIRFHDILLLETIPNSVPHVRKPDQFSGFVGKIQLGLHLVSIFEVFLVLCFKSKGLHCTKCKEDHCKCSNWSKCLHSFTNFSLKELRSGDNKTLSAFFSRAQQNVGKLDSDLTLGFEDAPLLSVEKRWTKNCRT